MERLGGMNLFINMTLVHQRAPKSITVDYKKRRERRTSERESEVKENDADHG